MTVTHSAGTADDPGLPDWSLASWCLYGVVPLLIVVLLMAASYAGGAVSYWVLQSRIGVLESVTGLLALAAGGVALVASFHPAIRQNWMARIWLLLFSVAMVYFAGEDLNWGQYYFGWEVPQYFLDHNKEQETNLHNMSTWFNQKPRLIVQLWLVVACIAVPLGWRLPRRLTERFVPAMFWPDRRLVFVAALALLAFAADWLSKRDLIPRTMRWSEVEEIYFAYGWLIYAFLLRARVREQRWAAPAQLQKT
jgi:hypothetical protein